MTSNTEPAVLVQAPGRAAHRRGALAGRLASLRYLILKIASAVPMLLGVIVVNFTLIHLAPGDPISMLVGDTEPTAEQLAALYAKLGLDQPMWRQFLDYLLAVVQADLGYSYVRNTPVLDLILSRLPNTVMLMMTALIIATILGVLMAIAVARRPRSRLDRLGSVLAVLGYSIPGFWLAQIVLLVFALNLGLFPTNGMTSTRHVYEGWAYVRDLLHHMVLPVLVLCLREMAVNFRYARASMRDALSQDYIIAARAKGLSDRRVMFHACRNGLLPVITVFGLNMSEILAGSVTLEIVFGWPGLGRLTYDAMYSRDYPLLMGIFVFISIGIIITNLVVDIVYGLLDPRVRQK